MKANLRIVPDYEVIVCPPEESFRWRVHDYPHYLAKWNYHPEYELHLAISTSGTMMVGDFLGDFEPGNLILTGPNVPHNWVSNIPPGELVRGRDMIVQFTPDFAEKVAGFCPELSAVRALFDDAAFGVEFSGATAAAVESCLRDRTGKRCRTGRPFSKAHGRLVLQSGRAQTPVTPCPGLQGRIAAID